MKKIDKESIDKARQFACAMDTERRGQRRENRRRLTVAWVGGIFAFIGVNGLFFFFVLQSGIFELLSDNWGLRYDLSAGIIAILWCGFAYLVGSAFFWLSDKTGLDDLIEQWIVSGNKTPFKS